MLRIARNTLPILFAALLMFAPAGTQALSFGLGGRVVNTTACAAPPGGFLIDILTPRAAGGAAIRSYLWTPGVPYLYPGVPRPGQNVIFLAGFVPVPCAGFGLTGPRVGAGFPVLFLLHGSSVR